MPQVGRVGSDGHGHRRGAGPRAVAGLLRGSASADFDTRGIPLRRRIDPLAGKELGMMTTHSPLIPEGLTKTQEVRALAKQVSVSERTVWRALRQVNGGAAPDANFTTVRVRRQDAAALRGLASDGMSMADVVSALVTAYRQ